MSRELIMAPNVWTIDVRGGGAAMHRDRMLASHASRPMPSVKV
jgi:hypothetical protein